MTLVVVDTSVWARRSQPEVREALAVAIEADAVGMIVPIELELLRSAWGARDHEELRDEYESLHQIPLTREIAARALDVQASLARRGHHRGPSVVDLFAAAAAEHQAATLWHCDRHFELIAEVTRQTMTRVGH